MRQLVLEKIVVSGFPPVNKRCLWLKGNTFYFWYQGAWRSVDSNVDIDSEYIDEKVSSAVSEVLGNAPENLDSLEEIANYISAHEVEATQRGEAIAENKVSITELEEKVDSLEGGEWSGWTDVP